MMKITWEYVNAGMYVPWFIAGIEIALGKNYHDISKDTLAKVDGLWTAENRSMYIDSRSSRDQVSLIIKDYMYMFRVTKNTVGGHLLTEDSLDKQGKLI